MNINTKRKKFTIFILIRLLYFDEFKTYFRENIESFIILILH